MNKKVNRCIGVRMLSVWGMVLISGLAVQAAPEVWPPTNGVPMTRWGKAITDDQPILPEYPRPQLVREQWLNLNGPWDYAVEARSNAAPATYTGKIRVPFPAESVLSRVNKRIGEENRLWYRRTFQIPTAWSGQRVLLHFGAVDWEAVVLVNGKAIGTHQGGYDGFTFDITDALKATGAQEVIVAVLDPIEGGQPNGKQGLHPEGIFYTPVTGIWQTVWLEPVPQTYIKELKIIPDVDSGKVRVSAVVNGEAGSLTAVVMANGKEIASAKGRPGEEMVVSLPDARLWCPDDPFLYDLKVSIRKRFSTVDTVTGYFGMRKIALGPDEKGRTRMLLNNKFVFQNGFLDQGFWPDGIYTAPTDEALRYDIEMTKKLGFNMTRKHIKVEPDRWYYWCDKLGLLVWQDMPSAIVRRKPLIPDIDTQFELELRRMVQGRFNHPSIIMWVLFNEGWGLEMSRTEKEIPSDTTKAMVKRMFAASRQEDSTRLINHESGAGGGEWQGKNPWDLGLGDIVDFHCYGGHAPMWEKNRASVIGETGWGCAPDASVDLLLSKETDPSAISAFVITQLTDVETEKNGALTYDRVFKGNTPVEEVGARIRKLLLKTMPPSPKGVGTDGKK